MTLLRASVGVGGLKFVEGPDEPFIWIGIFSAAPITICDQPDVVHVARPAGKVDGVMERTPGQLGIVALCNHCGAHLLINFANDF